MNPKKLEKRSEPNTVKKARAVMRELARQEQMKNCVPAPRRIQDAVRALVVLVGRVDAAAEIGLSKETVLSICAGLGLRPGSRALLREWHASVSGTKRS